MKSLHPLMKPLGSLKMAVVLIFALALVLAIGTFFESYYSREYAYNIVYGSLWFRILLLFLGVNILAAALLRLPPQKKLYGFYLSHIGLLLLLAGSLLTLLYGIDGELTLPPTQFNKTVRLSDPVLYAQIGDKEPIQVPLPLGVFPSDHKQTIPLPTEGNSTIFLRRFIPYAKEKVIYQEVSGVQASGLQFTLFAPQAASQGILSSPPSHYPEQMQLGPLRLFFLGELPENCPLPEAATQAPWFFIGREQCAILQTPPEHGAAILSGMRLRPLRLVEGADVFALESAQENHLLIPQVSAWPLAERTDLGLPKSPDAIRPVFSSPYRLYAAAEVFSRDSVVFYSTQGKLYAALYHPPQKPEVRQIDLLSGAETTLPWMKLKLTVQHFNPDGLPVQTYVKTEPTPGEKNKISALAIEAGGFIYWLASGGNITRIPIPGGQVLEFFLGFRTFALPWNFRLERFKMDNHPGTRNPASYESFVNIQDEKFENMENAHIYMNNPLKKGKYTFYQASYFQAGQDRYGSVLQVNYDPGRFIKYAGSLVLVAGTMFHFYLRRTRRAET